jgi:Ca-activated chloride channel homolog
MAGEVRMNCLIGRNKMLADNEPKLVYVLLEVLPTDAVSNIQMPLNLSLVLDRSGSMSGDKMQNLKKAVNLAFDSLGPQDTVSVVAFDDRSVVLIPSQSAGNVSALRAAIATLEVEGGTMMSGGMQDGLLQLRQAHSEQRVSRMLLLTDGQTGGDSDDCRDLADECKELGIPITALGLGSGWNEELLVDLAARTPGGMAAYLNRPDEIGVAFSESVKLMQSTVVRNAFLTLRLVMGVTPRRVWRVVPLISDLGATPISDRDVQVPLGDMEAGVGQAILLELQTNPRAPGDVRIAQAELRYDVPSVGLKEEKLRADVILKFVAHPAESNEEEPQVMEWVGKATVHRLKTQALTAEKQGDLQKAAQFTRQAATVLLSSGDQAGAAALSSQTKLLEQGQETSDDYKRETQMGQATVRLTRKLS